VDRCAYQIPARTCSQGRNRGSCRHWGLQNSLRKFAVRSKLFNIARSTFFRRSFAQLHHTLRFIAVNERSWRGKAVALTLPVLENARLRPRFAGLEDFQAEALATTSESLRGKKSCHETLDVLDEFYANSLTGNERLD